MTNEKWISSPRIQQRVSEPSYIQRGICKLSTNQRSNATVTPMGDYYLHTDNTITLGRRHHKKLRDELSAKFKKTGEMKVDFNLTELKSKYNFRLRPLDEGLDHIQDYIIEKSKENKTTNLNKLLHGAQIVCSRRTLKVLGSSPYVPWGWSFAIEKYHDIFFLKELGQTEHKCILNDNTCFGFIFEELIFSSNGKPPPIGGTISTFEKMYVATLTRLSHINTKDKGINVFATASIDGLDGDGKYIEAKTSSLDNNQPKITLEWWLQSKFASIETIIQGIKITEDNTTKIKDIRKVNLVDLNLICNKWEGNICCGAIHQIFAAIISNYDDFINDIKSKRQMEDQPRIILMKTGKQSPNIMFQEDRRPFPILKPEFKNRFPETK